MLVKLVVSWKSERRVVGFKQYPLEPAEALSTADLIANKPAAYRRSRAMATPVSCAGAGIASILTMDRQPISYLGTADISAVWTQTLSIYWQWLAAFVANTAMSNTADISAMCDSSLLKNCRYIGSALADWASVLVRFVAPPFHRRETGNSHIRKNREKVHSQIAIPSQINRRCIGDPKQPPFF